MRLAHWFYLASLLLLAACGGTSMVSVDDEEQMGEQASREVRDQIGIYNAEFLTTYVDSVGRRLVAELNESPYYFRFKIVDQFEPNAFALPGG